MEHNCVVLGGGGHAKILVDALQSCGGIKLYGVLDVDRALWGESLLGVSILGGDNLLPELIEDGVNCFVVGLGSIGDHTPRKSLFDLGIISELHPFTVIHPSATCSRWSSIGPGGQLLSGSIVNAGAELGTNVIINSGAIVEHDCVIGNHVHVATGARLASTVAVGEGAHIGAGATVKQSVCIGEHSIVGAGAVVVKDVLPNSVVAGVPARPMQSSRG